MSWALMSVRLFMFVIYIGVVSYLDLATVLSG